jgi:hypothetical protein
MARFVKDTRESGVTLCSMPLCWIASFGLLTWACPLVFYSILLFRSRNDPIISTVWILNVCFHVFTGVLANVDAYFYNGRFWPLRAFIMGGNSFVAFTLPGLFGYYISTHEDTSAILLLVALGCTCMFNACLVAVIFELLQKCK